MSGSYFLVGSNLEKCGKCLGKQLFFKVDMAVLGHCIQHGQIWPD